MLDIEIGQFEEFFQERLLAQVPRTNNGGNMKDVQLMVAQLSLGLRSGYLSRNTRSSTSRSPCSAIELRRTEDFFNRVTVKDNVALITVLQSKVAPHFALIVAQHLHWDPNECDVKLVQAAMLVEELGRIAALHKNGNSAPAVLICACLVLASTLFRRKETWRGIIRTSKKYTYGAYTREGVSHTFDLESAYASVGELDFTNFTPGFRCVIDYVWYTRNSLAVTHVLGNVDREYLSGERNGVVGFPHPHHPSDHVPIMVAMVTLAIRKGSVGGNGKRG
ncbi:Glucose-repressible alcohol dehydrogenase transcriptional effector [Entophlyctis luteolus]|nr:Glucose-repressible alcohol dehydrogenase transcriptional effector [Entophlyctis luteolus]